MGIVDIFSKRQKKLVDDIEDVYEYNDLPTALRIQIVHIVNDALGRQDDVYSGLKKILMKEYGVFNLVRERCSNDKEECIRFILQEKDVTRVLDAVEMLAKVIDSFSKDYNFEYLSHCYGVKQSGEDAISELNYRFKEHAIGYEYVGDKIIKVDSQYIHKEIIKPAIKLMYEEEFVGASQEFFSAHEHYRNKEYKESIADALKAFESTMKTICDRKKYKYNKNKDTTQKLIRIIFDNGLIPNYLESHFTAVRTTLEAGLPTVRNKTSGHGQGQAPNEVPDYFASYAINLAANNIVFLINAFKVSKK